MKKVLNLQLSLFGTFKNIQPDIALTMRITEALSGEGFVPGTAQVNNVDLTQNKLTQEARLQMVSEDKEWVIVFFAERIDINYVYSEGNTVYYNNIDDAFIKAKRLCEKVFTPIAATTGVRLALNGRFQLNDIENEKAYQFYNKFLVAPRVFDNRVLSEWSVHYNSPMKLDIEGRSIDNCNFIINVGNSILIDLKTGKKIPRNEVSIDINTPAENTNPVYKYQQLISFADNALELMKTAMREIEGEADESKH